MPIDFSKRPDLGLTLTPTERERVARDRAKQKLRAGLPLSEEDQQLLGLWRFKVAVSEAELVLSDSDLAAKVAKREERRAKKARKKAREEAAATLEAKRAARAAEFFAQKEEEDKRALLNHIESVDRIMSEPIKRKRLSLRNPIWDDLATRTPVDKAAAMELRRHEPDDGSSDTVTHQEKQP